MKKKKGKIITAGHRHYNGNLVYIKLIQTSQELLGNPMGMVKDFLFNFLYFFFPIFCHVFFFVFIYDWTGLFRIGVPSRNIYM